MTRKKKVRMSEEEIRDQAYRRAEKAIERLRAKKDRKSTIEPDPVNLASDIEHRMRLDGDIYREE